MELIENSPQFVPHTGGCRCPPSLSGFIQVAGFSRPVATLSQTVAAKRLRVLSGSSQALKKSTLCRPKAAQRHEEGDHGGDSDAPGSPRLQTGLGWLGWEWPGEDIRVFLSTTEDIIHVVVKHPAYHACVWTPKSFADALQQRFSYHRWADERDGVRKTAHDHLSSLRLKLTGRQREKKTMIGSMLRFHLWLMVFRAFTMLFHTPLASSSWPFMVKWKQSWVKKVMSIFPFCSDSSRWRLVQLWYMCVCWSDEGVPAGGEGQRASERAGEWRQSRSWRNGRCRAAPRDVSVRGENV